MTLSMTTITIIIASLCAGFCIGQLFQSPSTKQSNRKVVYVDSMQYTKQETELLRAELINLRNQVQFAQPDTMNNLPVGINQALDTYNKNNIQVPVEIIEAVNYAGIVEPNEAIKFIENERKNMKADLGKRLYI